MRIIIANINLLNCCGSGFTFTKASDSDMEPKTCKLKKFRIFMNFCFFKIIYTWLNFKLSLKISKNFYIQIFQWQDLFGLFVNSMYKEKGQKLLDIQYSCSFYTLWKLYAWEKHQGIVVLCFSSQINFINAIIQGNVL